MIVLFASFVGCGEEATGDQRGQTQDEPRCLSCDAESHQEEQQEFDAAPRVYATPQELLFYPSGWESENAMTRHVSIVNATTHLVYVTRARVQETQLSEGGSDYFIVDPVLEHIPLNQGDTTSLAVSFLGSERQQWAVLEVTTTDAQYKTLTVSLTGKIIDPE